MSQQRQAPETRLPSQYSVLYIAGSGRSGSTLLDRMLGQHPAVIAVGELTQLWRGAQVDTLVCGCGEPVRSCPFWSDVAERSVGGWESEDYQRLAELQELVSRHRHLPLLVVPAVSRHYQALLLEFGARVRNVYDAIGEVSGKPVIVDSSKEVAFAFVLLRALGDKLRVVHLVRNGTGVAHSWTKAVHKPEIGSQPAFLARYRPVRTSGRWVAYNCMVDLLALWRVPRRRVQYEDIIREPARSLASVLELSALHGSIGPLTDFDFLDDHVVRLQPTHSVAGNPMRFRHGPTPLRLDEAWRSAMRTRDRRLVTLVASPLLLRFGYLSPPWSRGHRRELEDQAKEPVSAMEKP